MAPNPKSLFGFRSLFHKRPRGIKPRDIKPENPTQPSLANLDHEIIILVIYRLYSLDPQSVNSLALVCSDLYSGARYVQHSETWINISKASAGNRLQLIVRNNHLPAVHTLHVTGGGIEIWDDIRSPGARGRDRRKLELDAWGKLADVVPQMSGLRHLHWTGATIPDSVLDHLDKHPQIHLHLLLSVDIRLGAQYVRLKQLPARVKNLSSALIHVSYPTAGLCRPITRALKELLVSSPRLGRLSLDVDHPRGDCILRGPEALYCGLGLAEGERLSPLRELVVMSYPWGRQPTTPGSLVPGSDVNCLGYPEPTGTEMEYWVKNMDFSQLRRLQLHGTSIPLAEHLAPHFGTTLEEVKFVCTGDTTLTSAIANFFVKLPCSVQLSTLDMSAIQGLPLSSISEHASDTLHTLSVHHQPLGAQELSLLRDALPYLERLSVVCSRDVEPARWPYDTTLATLCTFPRLRHLTLCFKTGPRSEPHQPYLTFSSARDIFDHLQQQQHQRHDIFTRLQQVHLHSGLLPQRPERGGKGFFSDEAYWPRDNETSFICERESSWNGRDDDVRVTCPKLSKLQNEMLRLYVAGQDDADRGRKMVMEESLDVLVAWKGPMRVTEWLEWRGRRGIHFGE